MIFLSQLEWYCVYWDEKMIAGRLRGPNGHQSLKNFVPFLANALNRFEHIRLVRTIPLDVLCFLLSGIVPQVRQAVGQSLRRELV